MACLSSRPRRSHLLRSVGAIGASCLIGCPATTQRVDPDELGPSLGDAACELTKDDPRCRPESSHERVGLRNHLAGCEPGPRGKASFIIGDEVLAELAPGEQRSVRLSRGDVTVTVRVAPRESVETTALSLGGAGPVAVETGCAAGRFAGSGLAPLVLRGPEGACPAVRVRASGLDFDLGPGLTWTLLVPHGEHVVRFGGVAQTVSVGAEGALLAAPGCGVQGSTRQAPSMASTAIHRAVPR
jgi:hypothetical protein